MVVYIVAQGKSCLFSVSKKIHERRMESGTVNQYRLCEELLSELPISAGCTVSLVRGRVSKPSGTIKESDL